MTHREPSAPTHPKRGEIYLVNFDPTVGAEIQKTRPAIIIQNDVANRYSAVTIVAAITSRADERLFPTEAPIPAGVGGLQSDSLILLNQLRTIDKQRLVRRLGTINDTFMYTVENALLISLGMAGY